MSTIIQPGEFVQWMHCSGSGRSLRFSTRRGTVLRVRETEAEVKVERRALIVVVPLSELRKWGQPSPVKAVFDAMCEATKPTAEQQTKGEQS